MRNFAASLIALTVLPTLASAADLPRRAPPPVFTPVPVFTWTGFYLGFNAGYVVDHDTRFRNFNDPTTGASATGVPASRPALVALKSDGFTGGGQIGYNYQFTPGAGVVVGIEADAAYTDLTRLGGTVLTNPNVGIPRLTAFRSQMDFLGTVRGRIGYAFDRVFIYGTGGLAYGDVQTTSIFYQGATPVLPINFFGTRSRIDTGYAAGGGIEYALPVDSFLNFFKSSAVTVKVEGLYYNLGTRNMPAVAVAGSGAVGAYGGRISTDGALVRAGLNYKFGSY